MLIVPGLGQGAARAWRWPLPVPSLVGWGYRVVALDLTGRGDTGGAEDFGGPIHHLDVLAGLDHLGGEPLAVLSLSLGASATAGALLLADRPRVELWMDWEGPSDREIITAGGTRMAPARGHGLADDGWWRPREPARAVGHTGVPWARFQGRRDHAQPGERRHALRMLQGAATGSLPWFLLNDHAPSQVPARPRWLEAGELPRWTLGTLRLSLPT
ncbi:MAG: alpha/beta hydrolase [Deltaproteobacteria bacterium]|nr:alpha/beta hydrolase [Deltaproteobacteria bacterium]